MAEASGDGASGDGASQNGGRCVLWAEGEVRQAAIFGEYLVLRRRIEADLGGTEIRLTDTVTNAGFDRTPHMFLYHVNVGWPLLDEGTRFDSAIAETRWCGDSVADQGISHTVLPGPQPGFVGQVYEHVIKPDADGRARARLLNDRLRRGFELDYDPAAQRPAAQRPAAQRPAAQRPAADNYIVRFNVVSEAAVRDSGLDWTVLRPSGFMSNALRWLPQLSQGDTVREPFADIPVAVIDPSDIGAIAAATLSEPGHVGHSYRLTGPQALLPAEQLAILGGVLGRDLRLKALPDDDARREMSTSMPEPSVDAFFEFSRGGTYRDDQVTGTTAELLGRPARTFSDWAQAHAEAFAS